MLGPIFVLKLKLSPKAFGLRLVAEMWIYPDGARIVELPTKCLPGKVAQLDPPALSAGDVDST